MVLITEKEEISLKIIGFDILEVCVWCSVVVNYFPEIEVCTCKLSNMNPQVDLHIFDAGAKVSVSQMLTKTDLDPKSTRYTGR